MQRLIRLFSTFFYLGYSRWAPGTVGSLGGVFLWWLVKDSTLAHSGLILLVGGLGFWVSGKAEEMFEERDSKKIVIDEVAGCLVAFYLIPFELKPLILGFLFYRTFDILKPFPSRQLQNLSGGSGVMLDDIVAGLYTNLLLQIAIRL